MSRRWFGLWMAALVTACTGSQGAKEPSAAALDQRAATACDAGDTSACQMLGLSLFLEARVNQASAASSLDPFQKSCDADDWYGCAMTAAVKEAEKQDAREAAAKAFSLAEKACNDEGRSEACIYLGDWAAQAGDRAKALEHFRAACLANLKFSGPDAANEYSCLQAVEHGASARELASEVKVTSTSGCEPARRISGDTDIQPSPGERRQLCKLRMSEMKAQAVLCLSEKGLPRKIYFPQYSGARRWDQRIFEAMRTWRYTPFFNEDGTAVPACTEITFVFSPSC